MKKQPYSKLMPRFGAFTSQILSIWPSSYFKRVVAILWLQGGLSAAAAAEEPRIGAFANYMILLLIIFIKNMLLVTSPWHLGPTSLELHLGTYPDIQGAQG